MQLLRIFKQFIPTVRFVSVIIVRNLGYFIHPYRYTGVREFSGGARLSKGVKQERVCCKCARLLVWVVFLEYSVK